MNALVLEGFTECLISALLFGSSYVPIKKYDYGDGIFLIQIRSTSILLMGFIFFAYTGFVHFYPLVMIGGLICTLGNLMLLPCVAELGIGMAALLYSFSDCLIAWLTGNFGLFWINARPPRNTLLNYLGLVSLLAGGVLITFIRPDKIKPKPNSAVFPAVEKDISLEKESNGRKKINVRRSLAIAFSLIAGFLFGENPTPVIIAQDQYKNMPKQGIYYIFSFYFGIFLSSSIVFAIYCIIKKNKPFVNNELVLPSLVSGIIWAIAQGLFIISIEHLSLSVAGCIASIVPGCVSVCWGVFWFKEIKGKKNFILLGISIFLASLGTIVITISK